MCGGGGGGKAQAAQAEASARAQEQSLALQREQMAMQQEQMDLQQAQYREQLAISNAPPPPPLQPVAMTARSAIEMPVATAAGSADTGAVPRPSLSELALAAASFGLTGREALIFQQSERTADVWRSTGRS
jgi:hypothetical protein